jgi:multidrug resistance protein, MATE family
MSSVATSPRARVFPWSLAALQGELRPLVAVAGPVALAEVGWMAMGLVDTLFVGRVSATALGAVAVGSHLFFAVAIFGLGTLLGLDYFVANARGRGEMGEAHRSLVQSFYLATGLGGVLSALLWTLSERLDVFGVDPAVLPEATVYTAVLTLSLLPQLYYAGLRRYLQAIELVRPITISAISANVLNAFANWVLVFGNLGFPAMGAVGSAWATVLSRFYLFACLAYYAYRYAVRNDPAFFRVPLRPEPKRLRHLVAVGFPAAAQSTLEVGVFTAATLLAAGLDATSLAAHQIALQTAALSFMVPLGISSAAAVRVGHAVGRGDAAAAARAGWAAILLGGLVMSGSAAVFVLWPSGIVRAFTTEAAVIATGAALLRIAAVFQLFDGLQVVATGVLRGTGDTRTPALTSLVCFWLIALPVAWWACFPLGGGVRGLWVGLCLGLILVALTLVTVWTRRMR